jgi:hypothetical protein
MAWAFPRRCSSLYETFAASRSGKTSTLASFTRLKG